ncbi:sigma-70 family RNA polymerase sigma factor (plasmid) [Nostoc sp. C052]|uniref:sigma-70 family RNA polymerase sigma factor n=1 Tax=Nostoc sp. C052 TaxID=2576902 RepID=UPI0015C3960A|nr:sigma-70 family RNA polymerase sigma factor [Nostoc sp. C052]QLE46492.1 sigma-70 family RNA polymerase sigma factor [Nostoc sp. C052]
MPKTVDMVKDYLQEISSYPLLTATQEINLSRQVQQMIALLDQKKKLESRLQREATDAELSKATKKSPAEISSIIRDGQAAKEQMVVANLRLVVSIAKNYQNRKVEFLDLIQEGTLGLDRGVEKFDPDKGFKFSTYAHWWITQHITRGIAEKSRTIRLPIHLTEALNKIRKHERQLAQALRRNPTLAELSQSTGLPPEKIRKYLQCSQPLISLELKIGKNKDNDLSEVLPVPDENLPGHILERDMLLDEIENILKCLTPIQRDVIVWRYGLIDGNELTLLEIGKKLDLGKERIRQIQYQALAVLRNKKDYIRSCLD